jgi:zinc protease
MRGTLPVFAALVTASTAAAQAPVREQPPPPTPLRPFVMPTVNEARLANGMRLVVVERRSLPIVTARVIVDAGSVYERSDKHGVAALTGTLLVEGGTQQLTGAELAEQIERLGAQISSTAAYNLASVSVTALADVFPRALELAAQTILQPRFDSREFERVRAQTIAAAEQARSTVEGVANEAFARAIYDSASSYARLPQGTPASLRGLTREDVVSWHRSMYSPQHTTLLMVGDISFAAARQLAERVFGTWTASAREPLRAVNRAVNPPGTRLILIDRPGSVQSAIYAGQAGIPADDPEFFPMLALNRVLGGGFNARMNMNLRERHGFTYGAFTTLSALRGTGSFYVSSSVRTSATDSALTEVVSEFRRIVRDPLPGPELSGAVSNLVASFPNSLQSVQDLATRMQTVLIYNLPLDYYATYRERLGAVTGADISRIVRARLVPDALTIVIVGDLSKIEAPIRARNFGTVEVWDADGRRIR